MPFLLLKIDSSLMQYIQNTVSPFSTSPSSFPHSLSPRSTMTPPPRHRTIFLLTKPFYLSGFITKFGPRTKAINPFSLSTPVKFYGLTAT